MPAPLSTLGSSTNDDPEVIALIERWKEAVQKCQADLRPNELRDIREFQGPQQLDADLRRRLEESAQGKLKNIVPQISPFFDILQQMLLLFTAIMPSIPLTLVSGGAYLAVKKCAEFESASRRVIDILDKIKQQLILFRKYSEALNQQESCRQGLVEMFIAMIKFWVASLRFLGRNSQGTIGDEVVADRWHTLNQKFLISLEEIESAVKFIQQLQDAETSNWVGGVAKAQSEVVERLPDVDLSEVAFPCDEIPALDKSFLGRSIELESIEKALGKRSPSSLQMVVISGLGGVGKSALALNAAHRCRTAKEYDAIFWLHAEKADVLRESFTRIALRLLLRGASDKSDKDRNFMLVKNWLDKTAKSWLLIYDNVYNYRLFNEYLPPNTGSIIITTRFQNVSFGVSGTPTRIQLEKFSPDDSLKLFNELRLVRQPQANVENEKKQTQELLELIDGLALGIKQMASFISSKKWKISKFQEQYNKMAKYILEHEAPSASHTLSTLWSVQFEDILHTSSSKLLGLLSFCGPEKIPRELFELDEPLQDNRARWVEFCESYAEVEQAIDSLRDKALIDIKEGTEELSLHRLTQEAFLYNQYGLLESQNLQGAFDGLVALLDRRFPGYGREKSLLDEWATCSRYPPHVSALARIFKVFLNAKTPAKPIQSSELFAVLLRKATWYLQEIGDLRECLDLPQIASDACEDKDSLTFAYLCNTYVTVAVDQNDMARGQEYSEKSIAIREAKLEKDDLDLAISYSNYANALLNEGRFKDSLDNHALSDSIWADQGRDDEVYRGLSYLNTGRVYSLKGDATVAITYFQKAEKIFYGISNKIVHYTWGTLLMNQRDLIGALGKFKLSEDLAKASIPLQLVMSAIHYKLAVLNMKLGLSNEDAKENLRSAMTIAEYHQREAEIARIGRQLALAIEEDPEANEADKQEAEEHAAKAKEIKERLWKTIEKYIPKEARSEEEEYNWLVAAWYR